MLASIVVIVINILQNPTSATAAADLKLIQLSVAGLSAAQNTWQQKALYFLAHEVQEIADQAIKRGLEKSENKVHDKRSHDDSKHVVKLPADDIEKDFLKPPETFANDDQIFNTNFLNTGGFTLGDDTFGDLDMAQSLDWWKAPVGLDWENVNFLFQRW